MGIQKGSEKSGQTPGDLGVSLIERVLGPSSMEDWNRYSASTRPGGPSGLPTRTSSPGSNPRFT